MLELKISDLAKTSPEVTIDEMRDAIAYRATKRSGIAHQNLLQKLKTLQQNELLKKNAARLTAEAIARERGVRPTMTEARIMEVAAGDGIAKSEIETTEKLRDEAMEAYEDMMRDILHSEDDEDGNHG